MSSAMAMRALSIAAASRAPRSSGGKSSLQQRRQTWRMRATWGRRDPSLVQVQVLAWESKDESSGASRMRAARPAQYARMVPRGCARCPVEDAREAVVGGARRDGRDGRVGERASRGEWLARGAESYSGVWRAACGGSAARRPSIA